MYVECVCVKLERIYKMAECFMNRHQAAAFLTQSMVWEYCKKNCICVWTYIQTEKNLYIYFTRHKKNRNDWNCIGFWYFFISTKKKQEIEQRFQQHTKTTLLFLWLYNFFRREKSNTIFHSLYNSTSASVRKKYTYLLCIRIENNIAAWNLAEIHSRMVACKHTITIFYLFCKLFATNFFFVHYCGECERGEGKRNFAVKSCRFKLNLNKMKRIFFAALVLSAML